MTPASSDFVPTVGCCSLRVLLAYYVTFGVLGITVTARGDHMTTWEQSPSTGTPCACAKKRQAYQVPNRISFDFVNLGHSRRSLGVRWLTIVMVARLAQPGVHPEFHSQ